MPLWAWRRKGAVDDVGAWTLVDLPTGEDDTGPGQPGLTGQAPAHQTPTEVTFDNLNTIYKRLDFPSFATRFLDIYPRDKSEPSSAPISCGLVEGSFIVGKKPDYVALSYCWGNYHVTVPMLVDGLERQVTTNLEVALRQLQAEGVTLVWIDALCINQADNYERSYQVARMGSIYSGASKVVAWLGASAEESDSAMDLILQLATVRRRSPNDTTIQRTKAAINRLLARPYWKRVWIVQEIAKASKVEIWCHDKRIAWNDFQKGCDRAADHYGLYLQASNLRNLQHFCIGEQKGRKGFARMLLLEALLQTSQSQATDERDRVYALLGLTRDGSEAVPTPNYEQNAAEVFSQVSRFMIVTQGRSALILLACRQPKHVGSPSWMPTWAEWTLVDLPPWLSEALINDKEVGSDKPAHLDGDRLSLEGVKLDTVRASAPPTNHKGEPSRTQVKKTLQQIDNVLGRAACAEAENQATLISGPRINALVALWTGVTPLHNLPQLESWYEIHKDWTLHGLSIEAWVREYAKMHKFDVEHARDMSQLKPLEASLDILKKFSLRILLTTKSSLRIGPDVSQDGDLIVRLASCPLPVVLRPVSSGSYYIVVGESLGRYDEKEGHRHAGIGWEASDSNPWKTFTLI